MNEAQAVELFCIVIIVLAVMAVSWFWCENIEPKGSTGPR